ncbi:zinc finger HIT domain-containing protein 1 [Eudromia elegans]
MVEKKVSGRSGGVASPPAPPPRRLLDGPARQRRLRRQLEQLESDNHGEDPRGAGPARPRPRLPHFGEGGEEEDGRRRRRPARGERFRLRFRRSFQALLEEQALSPPEGPSYSSACAGPSRLPARPFCSVCGFPAGYTCVPCGARFCCGRCLGAHRDTRCLKWTM